METDTKLFPDYLLDLSVVNRAVELAKVAHVHQPRWDGTPYVYHLLRVASRCIHHGYTGTEVALTAILHDICEDTAITLTTVEQMFGAKVAANVDLLTQRPNETRASYFNRCMQGDETVLGVKFSDRVDNCGGLQTVPDRKIYKDHVENYFIELRDYFRPNQHRVKPTLASELEFVTTRAMDFFPDLAISTGLRS